MKSPAAFLGFLGILSAPVVTGQTPPSPNPATPTSAPILVQTAPPVEDWKPASSNQPGKDHPKANAEALKAAGLNSQFYVSPDTAHEWQTWRRSLREFAPMLFKD